MQISELAKRTGMSARALRHYEDRGLLIPDRTSGGYRDYAEADVSRVTQIKTMIDAGLNTATIRRYLDCARTGDHGTSLEMCPALRAELDSITERLNAKQIELRRTEQRLQELASVGSLVMTSRVTDDAAGLQQSCGYPARSPSCSRVSVAPD